ncbi:DUF3526 domain-containing protein [soil metagenome]
MIARIARKELVEMVRDGRFRWSAAIVVALLVGSLAVGWKNWSDVQQQHDRAQAEAREHFECQEEKNPHAAAHYGLYIFKPKLPLAFVDPGVDPYTGVTVYLEAHKQNDFRDRPARDATALQRFGELTAASVLQVLLPLVIIFLAFPAIAEEREQGTLRQVLSLGVRPKDLLLGKALGLTLALGLIALPAVVVGVIALSWTGPGAWTTWPNALALWIGYLFYLGIFLAVALLVSARAKSSRAALVGLLGFWILNTMVAPRLATDIARQLFPTPSALEFASAIERDIKRGIDGHDPEDQRLKRLEQDLLEKYDVDFIEDLPINFQGVALQASEEYGNRVFDRHYTDLWAIFERQDAVRKGLGFLAPTLAVRELSMALSGTDNAQFRDFANAAEKHRRDIVKRLNQDLEVHGADLGFMYQAGPELWESMPHFLYQAPGLGETSFRQGFAWVSLLLWLLVPSDLAPRSASRLRVD